jgi:hypothetical protein
MQVRATQCARFCPAALQVALRALDSSSSFSYFWLCVLFDSKVQKAVLSSNSIARWARSLLVVYIKTAICVLTCVVAFKY